MGTSARFYITDHPVVGPPDAAILNWFPRLAAAGSYELTSNWDDGYNCIAHAAEQDLRFWWPEPDSYWPDDVPRERTIEAFLLVFAKFGYTPCHSSKREFGFQKVALYLSAAGLPSHMARQLPSGEWTSKLGCYWDISHGQLDGLSGKTYGSAKIFLRRPSLRQISAVIRQLMASVDPRNFLKLRISRQVTAG